MIYKKILTFIISGGITYDFLMFSFHFPCLISFLYQVGIIFKNKNAISINSLGIFRAR